jgi:hypothetical protein
MQDAGCCCSTHLLEERIELEVGGGHQALPPAGVPHKHPPISLLKHLHLQGGSGGSSSARGSCNTVKTKN